MCEHIVDAAQQVLLPIKCVGFFNTEVKVIWSLDKTVSNMCLCRIFSLERGHCCSMRSLWLIVSFAVLSAKG